MRLFWIMVLPASLYILVAAQGRTEILAFIAGGFRNSSPPPDVAAGHVKLGNRSDVAVGHWRFLPALLAVLDPRRAI